MMAVYSVYGFNLTGRKLYRNRIQGVKDVIPRLSEEELSGHEKNYMRWILFTDSISA